VNHWKHISSLVKRIFHTKNQWQFLLKLLLSVGLIGVVLFLIDLRELIDLIVNSNPWYLLAVIILFYLNRVLMAYKWNLLLTVVDLRVPFRLLYKMYTIAPLSGILLPADLGGDVFRLYGLSRYKVNTKTVFASMVIERLLALVVTLLFAAIGLALAPWVIQNSPSYLTAIGWGLAGLALIVAGLIATANNVFQNWINKLVERVKKYPIVGLVADKVYHIYLSCCEYRKHPYTVTTVSGWTLLEQITPIVWHLLIAWAFHMNVSPLEVAVIVPIIVLAVRLPISLNAPGLQESLYVALFGLVGVSPSEAFLLSTTGRVLVLLAALPWGIHYLMQGHREQQLASLSSLDQSGL
jgi:hypothetical protein